MYNKQINITYEFLMSLFLLFSGILLFQHGSMALQLLFNFVGISMTATGILSLLRIFIKKLTKKEIQLPLSRAIVESTVGLLILFYPNLPISIFGFICGIYFMILAVIHFVTYTIDRRNKVSSRYRTFFLTIAYLIIGVLLVFSPYLYSSFVMNVIAVYFIFYGLSLLGDVAKELTPPSQKEKLKRRIRITLPIFVEALIPRMVLNDVNSFLQVDPEQKTDDLPDYQEKKDNKEYDLEIFVHITEKGFGAIGHIDLFFEGVCIAFGNYDADSLRLFETIGDGVLFVTEREKYIPFAIEQGQKTLFGFGLRLTDAQKEAVRGRLDLIKEDLVPWNPPTYTGEDDSYSAKLNHAAPTRFFKFKEGTFKTYFVLGSNCVKLADFVIGGAGIDKMNGIISPGTYFDYLNKEYASNRMLVVSKQIYN